MICITKTKLKTHASKLISWLIDKSETNYEFLIYSIPTLIASKLIVFMVNSFDVDTNFFLIKGIYIGVKIVSQNLYAGIVFFPLTLIAISFLKKEGITLQKIKGWIDE